MGQMWPHKIRKTHGRDGQEWQPLKNNIKESGPRMGRDLGTMVGIVTAQLGSEQEHEHDRRGPRLRAGLTTFTWIMLRTKPPSLCLSSCPK